MQIKVLCNFNELLPPSAALSLSLLFPRKTWKGKSKFSHTRKPWNMQQKLLRKTERNVGKESSAIALA